MLHLSLQPAVHWCGFCLQGFSSRHTIEKSVGQIQWLSMSLGMAHVTMALTCLAVGYNHPHASSVVHIVGVLILAQTFKKSTAVHQHGALRSEVSPEMDFSNTHVNRHLIMNATPNISSGSLSTSALHVWTRRGHTKHKKTLSISRSASKWINAETPSLSAAWLEHIFSTSCERPCILILPATRLSSSIQSHMIITTQGASFPAFLIHICSPSCGSSHELNFAGEVAHSSLGLWVGKEHVTSWVIPGEPQKLPRSTTAPFSWSRRGAVSSVSSQRFLLPVTGYAQLVLTMSVDVLLEVPTNPVISLFQFVCQPQLNDDTLDCDLRYPCCVSTEEQGTRCMME